MMVTQLLPAHRCRLPTLTPLSQLSCETCALRSLSSSWSLVCSAYKLASLRRRDFERACRLRSLSSICNRVTHAHMHEHMGQMCKIHVCVHMCLHSHKCTYDAAASQRECTRQQGTYPVYLPSHQCETLLKGLGILPLLLQLRIHTTATMHTPLDT